MLLWIELALCTSAILYSGKKLSLYGDIIAEKTGMGRSWIGVVLMASVTSLPELVTGISSVTFAGVPDIAVGDVMGACVLNMLTLAILDAIHSPAPISTRAHHGHVLSAGFGILLFSIAALSLFLRDRVVPFGWIGMYSLLFIVFYFLAMRLVYSYEKRRIAAYIKEVAIELRYEAVSMRSALLNYGINALVIIVAATLLPGVGEGIAKATGLGQTFVGNIFIAVSTTLPELIVSISAVRMGAVDLAIGNLFGSNIFNMLILAIDDLLFVKGPILSLVDMDHVIPALSAIAMTTVAIIGLTYRAERKRLFLSWDSLCIVLIYLMNILFLYFSK